MQTALYDHAYIRLYVQMYVFNELLNISICYLVMVEE